MINDQMEVQGSHGAIRGLGVLALGEVNAKALYREGVDLTCLKNGKDCVQIGMRRQSWQCKDQRDGSGPEQAYRAQEAMSRIAWISSFNSYNNLIK